MLSAGLGVTISLFRVSKICSLLLKLATLSPSVKVVTSSGESIMRGSVCVDLSAVLRQLVCGNCFGVSFSEH